MTVSAVLGLLAVLALGGVAQRAEGAQSCGARVLGDWADNGRLDRSYRLTCYEEAIATMPVDIRDYTNAREVIELALTSAVRGQGGDGGRGSRRQSEAAPGVDTSSWRPPPAPLVALAGLALALLAAAALGYLRRAAPLGRRQPHR